MVPKVFEPLKLYCILNIIVSYEDEVFVTGCPPIQTIETIKLVLDTQGYSSEPACEFNVNLTVVLTVSSWQNRGNSGERKRSSCNID